MKITEILLPKLEIAHESRKKFQGSTKFKKTLETTEISVDR